VRRVLFLGDVDGREIDKFLQEAEAVGHLVAVRSALLAAVLNRQAGEMDPSTALERLKSLNKGESQTGTINFRYALAEFCDALLSGAHERLMQLHQEACQVPFRSRSWIPVEMFLESVGLPLPATPTQWLEPQETVAARWIAQLGKVPCPSPELVGISNRVGPRAPRTTTPVSLISTWIWREGAGTTGPSYPERLSPDPQPTGG
jgi:hypothetical protein